MESALHPRTSTNRVPMRAKSSAKHASSGKAPTPTPSRISRLKSLDDVRVELAKVYREARASKLPLDQAKGLAYLLSLMPAMIKDSDLERRVNALEGAASGTA
jgi:hypothetical protein